jgi:hypothetical protein
MAPYSLAKGDSVWVKIVSVNTYGTSLLSEAGNNAVILLVPDAPQNLQNVAAITDANQVGLVWAEGDNGGAVVIDWRIWYALDS